jgi:hypothetical protein
VEPTQTIRWLVEKRANRIANEVVLDELFSWAAQQTQGNNTTVKIAMATNEVTRNILGIVLHFYVCLFFVFPTRTL